MDDWFQLVRSGFEEEGDFFTFGDGSGEEPLGGVDYNEDIIAEIPGPSSGDVLELDITESIQRIVAGGENLGWIFVPGGSNGVGIASSEASSNQPLLTIMVEGASPPEAARVLPEDLLSAGSSFAVSIEVTPGGAGGDVAIVETLPAGFTASGISNGGTFAAGAITWNLAAVSSPVTLTYTATTSADPGTKANWSGTVNANFQVEGSMSVSLLESLGMFMNHIDIGTPGADGDATLENGAYSVIGSGHDIWDSADDFHFLYMQVEGDFKMTIEDAFIGPIGDNPSSNDWQKMGIMARQDLTPGSMYVYSNLRSSDQAFMMQWRDEADTGAAWDGDGTLTPAGEHIGTITLERQDIAYLATYVDASGNVVENNYHEMFFDDGPIYLGIAVTSHTTGATSVGTFSNLTFEGSVVSVSDWQLY